MSSFKPWTFTAYRNGIVWLENQGLRKIEAMEMATRYRKIWPDSVLTVTQEK